MNGTGEEWHRNSPNSGKPPAAWRALCPFNFGFSPHRTCAPSAVLSDESLKALACKRWRLGSADGETGESSSSSSAGANG